MRFPLLAAVAAVALTAAPLSAECPCVPLTHLWVVKTCSDWNCASMELLLGGGDPQVIALPVAMDDGRWLVLRRFASGGAIDVGDDPFQLQQFEGLDGAMARYAFVSREQRPMMLTAPDGQILVISLKQPEARRRAVSH